LSLLLPVRRMSLANIRREARKPLPLAAAVQAVAPLLPLGLTQRRQISLRRRRIALSGCASARWRPCGAESLVIGMVLLLLPPGLPPPVNFLAAPRAWQPRWLAAGGRWRSSGRHWLLTDTTRRRSGDRKRTNNPDNRPRRCIRLQNPNQN
jgi:hypothetical protein